MVYMITLENDFVQAVKNGKKTIEVRTRIPKKLASGDIILMAQKDSHGRVALRCRVAHILEMHPDQLYINHSYQIYCDYPYYKRYTQGRDKVYGIVLTEIFEFPSTITTQSFFVDRAPQWFTFVCPSRYNYIMNEALNQYLSKTSKL